MKTLRRWVCSARPLRPVFVLVLLVTLLAPSVALAHQGHEHGNVIANADGDNVRLRTGPSYEDDEITRFPEGTGVDIVDGPYDAADGSIWYQVDIDGQVGYMVSDYLVATETDGAVDASEPSQAASGPTSGVATTNDSVNLRSGPSTADPVVRTLDAGEQVTLTGGNRDGWTSVSATGGDGWVFSDYLAFPNAPSGPRYTIDTVHLRTGPGTSFDSITYLDTGVRLDLTGGQEGNFVQVSSPFGEGWVAAEYIGASAPETPDAPAPAPEPEPEPQQPETAETRYTIDTVHLRSGPGTGFDSISYLESGVELLLTGAATDGFVEVTSAYGDGWVFDEYVGTGAPTAPEVPVAPEVPAEPVAPAEPLARFTTANVNLRSAASQTASVLTVIGTGTEVGYLGETEDGFAQVRTAGGDGWIAAEYLAENRPEEPAGPDPGADASGALITWPVAGGEWVISQGYNGSSHQNRTSSWQYYYSLDLKRADGATAGQPVYSAVTGTVRWIDEATGGMSIYMGNGLAYAYFHTRIDPGIEEGDVVTQGQYMGTIAPAGEAASGSSAHLHITIWETSDEGNWSRRAIPFSGNVAIEGIDFAPTGAGNDHRGYTFNP